MSRVMGEEQFFLWRNGLLLPVCSVLAHGPMKQLRLRKCLYSFHNEIFESAPTYDKYIYH